MFDENHRRLEGFLQRRTPAWLRVSGEDALAFLQGQFTQELRPDRVPPVSYGLWLNQKGRVLADSFVLRLGDGAFGLSSAESSGAVIRERLDAYIIADDVAVEDASTEVQSWVLAGAQARALFREAGVEPPAAGELVRVRAGWAFAGRLPGTWEWIGPGRSIGPDEPMLEWEDLERERICAGIPAIPRDVGPGDLAAEGELEAAAISFNKGCYLGQEVVARVNSMGRVRRRLMRVTSATGAVPTVPALLFQDERQVGEVRSAAPLAGGWVGLAMMSLAAFRTETGLALQPGEVGSIRALSPGGGA